MVIKLLMSKGWTVLRHSRPGLESDVTHSTPPILEAFSIPMSSCELSAVQTLSGRLVVTKLASSANTCVAETTTHAY
jgi:hypothetical protein